MENQSDNPQHGMADQGFRPFTLSAPTMVQMHASSSANAASIMMPISAPVQMPVLPSHLEIGSICPDDDGYIWKNLGVQEIAGPSRLIYYECVQANCIVKKSVTLSGDGQIIETVFRGSHNHPRPLERWHRDGPAGYGPGSQGYLVPEVHVAGTSVPMIEEGGEQLFSSSDSEDDDDGEAGAIGDATERHAAPPERITVQTRSGNFHQNEKRRTKSKVWEEFTAMLRDGKIESAVCNHCKRCFSAKSKGGTSHLRRHLKICPARPATGRTQQQRSSPHHDSSVVKNSKFHQDRSLGLLTEALISNHCSFSLTSSTNFRLFLASICPTYDVITQSAIREKFHRIFQSEKLKLKEEISLAPGGVFLTVARWGLESKYFMCVTAHFIDREWNMIRKIIRCNFVGVEKRFEDDYISMFPDFELNVIVWDTPNDSDEEDDNDKEADAEKTVKEVVRSWSLEGKVFGISLPKSISDTAIWGLQKNLTEQNYLLVKNKLLSLPCIIDSLHDLFDCEIRLFYSPCKLWIQYMTCSPLRTKKYKEILSQLQINRPSFGSQRWYLAFYVLEAALQFNKVFPNPEKIDLQIFPIKPCHILERTENLCNIARLIYDVIKVVSSPRNATLNSHFHTVWRLKIALLDSSRKENMDGVFNVQEMQLKFDNLWRKWYLWLCLAVALDPRYKIKSLEICFKQGFGSDAKREILEVKGKIYELFFRYSFQADLPSGGRLNECSSNGHGGVPVHDTRNCMEQSAHVELGELTRYLDGELIPENVPLDILKWWKDNASAYPTLARLARDILAIPGCAVSAESAFDKTDERVGLFNRKLSPEEIEALICTQDWIKSSEINDEVGGSRNMSA